MTIRRPSRPAAASVSLNACRSAKVAAAALGLLFFLPPAYSQVHSENRPPHPTPPTAAPTPPSAPISADEQFLLDSANRERAAEGLPLLRWDLALAKAARQHAQVMLSQNLLLHQCLNEAPLDERAAQAGAKFAVIAENIAVGPNAEKIHDGWMHSIGHRKNILNGDVTAIGIAVVRGDAGMFAVQDFSRPVEALNPEQQEQRIVALLKETSLQTVEATDDARKTCAMPSGYAGAQIGYYIRFEVTSLDQLPTQLLEKAKSREYRRAAVGACSGGSTGNFTRYRLAVLLN